ncbi:MAG: hypothetical protein ISR65_09315 [Bacteriovoracaceae bacterium]|nr:hypothetical protein [Bacteriovoracaceae bacterium]
MYRKLVCEAFVLKAQGFKCANNYWQFAKLKETNISGNIKKVLIRLLAVIGDVAISYAVYFFLLSFEWFRSFESSLNAPAPLPKILMIYSAYMVIRFYFTLVFSVSLSQALIGIKSEGEFVWKRVGGGIRVVFESIFSPILLFDLPHLGGRKTLKEVISFTTLSSKGRVLPIIFCVLFIPILSILIVASPLLQNLNLFDQVEFVKTKNRKEKLTKDEDFEKFKHYTSDFLGFSSFSSLARGRFLLLPSFDFQMIGKNKTAVPVLTIYDLKTKALGKFKKAKYFDFLEQIRVFKQGHSIFTTKYKLLNKLTKLAPSTFNKKKYTGPLVSRPLLNNKTTEQLAALVSSAFKINLFTLFDHIRQDSLNIENYLALKKEILNTIGRDYSLEVSTTQMGIRTILVLKEASKEYWLPLATMKAPIFEISFEGSANDKLVLDDFVKTFFSSVDWYFDYDEVFRFPPNKQDFSALTIIDYLPKATLSKDRAKGLTIYIYHYFFDICADAIFKKDVRLQELLDKTLQRYLTYTKFLNKGKLKHFSSDFRSLLKTLKSALQNKDRKYFNK